MRASCSDARSASGPRGLSPLDRAITWRGAKVIFYWALRHWLSESKPPRLGLAHRFCLRPKIRMPCAAAVIPGLDEARLGREPANPSVEHHRYPRRRHGSPMMPGPGSPSSTCALAECIPAPWNALGADYRDACGNGDPQRPIPTWWPARLASATQDGLFTDRVCPSESARAKRDVSARYEALIC